MAEAANAGTNFRQNRQRHADFFAQLLIPLQGTNIHEQGARSIGDVGEVQSLVALVPACTAGEIPQQPSIDGAGEQLAILGALTCTINVVENPRNLRTGRIRVRQNSGAV